MKKHLYRIQASLTFEFVVYAESEEQAQRVAAQHNVEAYDDYGKSFDCRVIGKRIPKELHETYAYGTDYIETVGYMLSDGAECQDQQWEVN
jgi:hypothetical protein